MRQSERVLQYMIDHGGITSLEAYNEIGCTRLSARIKELRNAGFIIDTQRETTMNRFGDKVSYARYKLSGKWKNGDD